MCVHVLVCVWVRVRVWGSVLPTDKVSLKRWELPLFFKLGIAKTTFILALS